ncbi:MAG: type secretion system protein [Verrucomicrobia bacterium]|nr:type secretion system protein [Verrucomicrobiota bacterium]
MSLGGLAIRPVASRQTLRSFTRQLASLVKAGMPLARGLQVLARQERNPRFQGVLHELFAAIEAGATFSEALGRHPRIFGRLHVNRVRAGEAGGALATVLGRLADFLEKNERLRNRVKSAMVYPAVILSVAGAILALLMTFVVPKFEQIFAGLLKGQPLPAPTQWLLGASHLVGGHIMLTLGGAAAAGYAFVLWRRTPGGVRMFDAWRMRAPLVGELAVKAAAAQFSRTLGSLLMGGLPLLEALAITRATAGNIHVADALGRVHERIKQGEGIAVSLEATGIFPEMVAGMIQVGEETGALAEMLERVADAYEDEVDAAVAGLTALVEPVLIVLMALAIGGIVIALFLPIVSVIQHLQ